MKSPLPSRKKGDKSASPAPTVVDAPASPTLSQQGPNVTTFPTATPAPVMPDSAETIDLERRRGQLATKVAELQWDLGGLVYEMAIRNRLNPDVIVKRAAALQEVDAELGEVERILRMERTGVAALCRACGAPHSAGAVFCWQCGSDLLEKVAGTTIAAAPRSA
ncbi:MAG: hypothetical protein JHC87_00990 [Thermoleophilaceae bacterium]|nr:hypothetical protein [Thermoleophilaceae bacterium]